MEVGTVFKIIACVILSLPGVAYAILFQELSIGMPTNISFDGSTIVGCVSHADGRTEACSWTSTVGITYLGELPGGNYYSSAQAVSGDGTFIVGCSASQNGYEAFRWASGEMEALGDLPDGIFHSIAMAITVDGTVVVGRANMGTQTFWWKDGILSDAEIQGKVTDMSADALVVVGQSLSNRAFRWENGALIEFGGKDYSFPYAISTDGTTIVGASGASPQAMIWRDGQVSYMPSMEYACDVSANGEIILGVSDDKAAIWSEADGLVFITDILLDAHIDVQGWSLTHPVAISGDGTIVTGYGNNPYGQTQTWYAVIPEPTSFLLLSIAGWLLYRHKSGHRREVKISHKSFNPKSLL